MKRTFAEITTDENTVTVDQSLYGVSQKRKKVDE